MRATCRKLKWLVRASAVYILLMVFAFPGKIVAAGSLDQTFGGGGFAFARVGTTCVGRDVAIQADGKIVIVGYTPWASGTPDFAVARFNTNGTLDTSFDGDGKVITPVGSGYDEAGAVAIQPDGKIVVAGLARVGTRDDFALVRYNSDGSLDMTFDSDGKVTTSIGDGDAHANAIAIQPDGKIVVVGGADLVANSSNYFGAARYHTDGSLDTSFDGDGKVTTFLRDAPQIDTASAVTIQPDGKIVLAGWSYLGVNADFALVRYNSDGSLDTSFDSDGKLTTAVSPTGSGDAAFGITLQLDGKILVAGGLTYSGFDSDSAVLRYNANGSLDTSFNGDGKVFISFGHLIESFGDVKVQPDGKIVAGGYKSNNSGSPTGQDITVARLNPNGSLDTTFDGDGKVISQAPPYGSYVSSVRILPNGKIVVAGSISAQSDAEFMVARYMGDLNTADFDGDTRTDISIFRPSNGQWWFSRSSDGANSALTFGVSTDKIVPGDYTGDGKSDVAIYRPSTGEWFVLRSEDFSYYAFPFGISTDVPTPADYDGDGVSDPAVYRPASSTWYILRSSGGIQITPYGISGDKPVPADYDGDGKIDLAVYRAPFQWWIQHSSTGTVVGHHLGVDGPAVPGDYSGDGRADLAMFSTTFNAWYIRRSEDGSEYSVAFGLPSDRLVPADYDGDGKNDFAVYRDGTWYVLQSSNGAVTIRQFGVATDRPVPEAYMP